MVDKDYILVTHAFPPKGGGGVQRIVRFIKKLQEGGWRPKIYVPIVKDASWLDVDSLNEVDEYEIYRVKRGRTKRLIDKVINKTIPIDPFIIWAIKVYLRMDKSPGRVILTSGPPHSVHLVGLLYALFNEGIWVADFRDHFTLGPNYKSKNFLFDWINKSFEKQVYKGATKIITNTNINQFEVASTFKGFDQDKIITIYNGYSKTSANQQINSENFMEDYYLYSGGLRGDQIDGVFYRMLHTVFQIRPDLKNIIKVVVLGDYSRSGPLLSNLGLENNIFFRKPVGQKDLVGYLNQSLACVTWQTDGKRYKGTIATKIFDYLGAQKPIFSLGQPDGEIDNLLKAYGIGLNVSPTKADEAALQFIQFHQEVHAGHYRYDQRTITSLEKFDRENQSQLLLEIFEKII